MNLHPASFSVRRWQFTLVVFFALIALGAQALRAIPKAEDPSLPLATFVVVSVLPGASPSDMERLVVDPIESKLGGLDDVKRIRSQIDDGLSVIQIEFREGVNADRKRDDLLRETAALRPSLPTDLLRLDVKQFDTANVNVLELALVSRDARYHDLDRVARDVKKRLEAVRGVGHVEVKGIPKQEVTVTLDLERLVALGISPLEVIGAIQADAQNLPAGSVEVGARRFNVKTSGDYASTSEIEDTVIRSPPAGAVRVRDVAKVELGDGEAESIARFGRERAVLVDVAMREGGNLLELRPRLQAEVESIRATLPPNARLEIGFDQSRNVAHRLSGFTRDFALAILVVLVTLLPLGTRASLVVMVSIPLSLAVGLALLRLLGFSINQLSIVGFVIALGLLVDDSIVVVENIARHLREGAAPRDAAIAATKQITVSVLGCTAALVLAFLPLLALPGSAGLYIRSMPVAVIASVSASLLVSLTIVPFLAAVLLKNEGEHGNRFFRALTAGIERVYRPILSRALRFPKTTIAIAALLAVGSVALVPRIGFGLFPKAGIPQFVVQIEAEDGSSLAETDRAARYVEGVLAKHPEVKTIATTVGEGHPQVYYNVAPRNERATVADVLAELEPMGARETEAAVERIRADIGTSYPGAHIEVHEFENGPPVEAPIALRLLGADASALRDAAARVHAELQKVPGVRDVRNPSADRRTDLRLHVDRDRAAVLGVAVPDVDRAVRLAVGGVTAGAYHEPGSEEARDVRVVLPRSEQSSGFGAPRPSLDVLGRVWIASRGGALPLAQIADVELEPSPTSIRHYDRERAATVTAQVAPGENVSALTKEAMARISKIELPKNVRLVVAGEAESREESFDGMGAAVVIAVFGLLAVLVLEFRTFRSTLIVASVVPLGIAGGLVALLLSGYTLSFTASIGFVALMGIEVKNSILLVDYTNHLREEGEALDAAIQRAGEARFVPVLFTTLTALGGLVPLVLERSPLYSPLAVVLVGGLISSTFLARVVTPVLYRLLPPAVEAREASPPHLTSPEAELPKTAVLAS